MFTRKILPVIGMVAGISMFGMTVPVGFADEQATDSKEPATKAETNGTTQSYLGLSVTSVPAVLASHLGDLSDGERGILIAEVTPASPAAKAGLQKYDVLTQYDDQDLYSPEQLVKRVRNDKPGAGVELQYVRSGELKTAKVTLGETPAKYPAVRNWPGFAGSVPGPFRSFRPPVFGQHDQAYTTEEQDERSEGTEWTMFQKMSFVKDDDGKYRVQITYKGTDGNAINREFTGTRQEVREAIDSDKDLPKDQRRQLLRTLDDRQGFPDHDPTGFPSIPFLNEEVFQWPDLNF